MSELETLKQQLEELNNKIEQQPNCIELLFERGKLHQRLGNFGVAMNDFIAIQELDPQNQQAQEYLDFLNEILNFRNIDMYNP